MQNFPDTVSLLTDPEEDPGFKLALSRRLSPVSHQWLDATTVFSGQPVRQLPEHHAINALEGTCCAVSKLVEGRPTQQLTVDS